MKIPILINPKCSELSRFEDAVRTINGLQTHFRLFIQKPKWLPSGRTETVQAEKLRMLVESKYHKKPTIALITNRFADNYFSHEWRQLAVITTYHWEKHYAPPPLVVYLI